MKVIRRIIISLGIVFFATCAGAMLLTHWTAFGWKALAIPTSSMRPAMSPGTLVLVHRVPDSGLKIGDVITYINPMKPNSTITHRIIKAYKINGKVPAYITKGDANLTADRSIVGGLVIGKVAWHIPKLGALLLWTKTWVGIAIMVYVPSLFIVGEEIQRMNKYFKQTQPYRIYEEAKKTTGQWSKRWAIGFSTTLVLLFITGLAGPTVLALLKSNTVALVNNKISVAPVQHKCTNTSNSNNVTVTNTNNQTGSSGNATNSNNTNSGSSTSGNVSNSNSTSTTITITNSC